MIEQVTDHDRLLAIIVRHNYTKAGVNFFTDHELSQQLAFMSHPCGHVIAPHVHRPVERNVRNTQEVLLIRSGRLRVDFYDQERVYLESRVLQAGDVILLASGGHGFEMLEPVEMFEVKQGPYAGDADKACFEPVPADRIRLPDGD